MRRSSIVFIFCQYGPNRPRHLVGQCDRHEHPRLSRGHARQPRTRSEEHTSELQSLMRISYAVFCLKKKKKKTHIKKQYKLLQQSTNIIKTKTAQNSM